MSWRPYGGFSRCFTWQIQILRHLLFYATQVAPRKQTNRYKRQLFFFVCLFVLNFYLFMAVLGLRFCARAFSSCGMRGPLFIAVRGPLTVVASLVAEHRLQTRRLSSCGARAQLLRGMWDLPRPGLEPVSPALAGRLSTTAPPGKPPNASFAEVVVGTMWFWRQGQNYNFFSTGIPNIYRRVNM